MTERTPLLGDLLIGELPLDAPCPPGWTRSVCTRGGWSAVYKTMTEPDEWMRPPPKIRSFGWVYHPSARPTG